MSRRGPSGLRFFYPSPSLPREGAVNLNPIFALTIKDKKSIRYEMA